MGHSHDQAHSPHHGFAHVMPPIMLLAVFAALIVLTVVTIMLNDLDLGPIEIFISMGIATIKAGLVISIFMHMMHDKPFNMIVFFFSLIFVSLFIGFTLMDSREYGEDIKDYQYLEIQKEDALKK
jgi:cytochrome c oxidase subunit 4